MRRRNPCVTDTSSLIQIHRPSLIALKVHKHRRIKNNTKAIKARAFVAS